MLNSYLVKSFETFTNPDYVPDEKVMNKAIDIFSQTKL